MIKKMTGILLALCLIVTMVAGSATTTFAASDSQTIYVMQEGSGKCTLASAVMMVRQTAINNGEKNWQQITQSSLRSIAWIEGAGLRHSFTYNGITVSYKNLEVENDAKKAELISLLKKHPEGIEIYLRTVPHAVYLTRYDAKKDVFYCADPSISVSEIPVDESWLRTLTEDATQDDIIGAVDCYWFVSSCNYKSTLKDPQTTTDPDEKTDEETNGSSDESDADIGVTGPTNPTPAEVIRLSNVNTYTSGLFKDLKGSEWYFAYAKAAYEMGLMNGSGGKFNPTGNITIGQTITIASRIHSMYYKNGESFTVESGDPWYKPYVDYAYKNGIIGSKYKNANMNANAARLEFAEILSKCLPDKCYEEINEASSGTLPDVSYTSEAGKAVYKLYKAGILTGSSDGKFHPANSISRSEASAVIARIADSSQRVER